METKKTVITTHTFSLDEVEGMINNYLEDSMLEPFPEGAEIRAKRGTASVKLTTLEVKFTEEK